MSITIPQAGSVAGRAAQVQIDQPDIGGFVAQVGSAVAQKMGQIKEQQRAVVYEKTQLDMTKETGLEYQRVSQLTDPVQRDAEWQEVEARIRDKYVNAKDENGQPIFTPEEADALGLSFQGLTTKHALAIGEGNIKLTQSQQTAAWLEAKADIATTAATADPDTMAALIEFGEAAIDRRVQQGIILPDQAVTEKQAFRAEVMNARATTALDQDPTAFIAAADEGIYDDLGPERVAQLKVTARAEADRRAAAAASLTEAEAKKRDAEIGARLGTIADLTLDGRKVADVDLVRNPPDEVKNHPDFPKAQAAVALADEIPNLRQMTVAELDALIKAEEDRTIVEEWDGQRLSVLREMREKKATALTTDPKTALVASGVIPDTDLTFDPANLEAFAASLSEAVSLDALAREKGHTSRSAIFSAEQRANLKAVLAPGADADAQAALATAIVMGAKGNVAAVLTDLEASPTFKRTVKILSLTGDTDMARTILRGQQKLDLDTTIKLPRADQIAIFDKVTGGAFDDAPVALREELMAAAMAVYADGAKGIDPAADANAATNLYKASLLRVTGAQPDRNGSYTVGGLQEVNGALTVLPYGVSVDDVEASWQELGRRIEGTYSGGTGRHGQGPGGTTITDFSAFAAASIYGGLPDLGSDPAARWETLTLRRVGETEIYELVYEMNGRMVTVPEKDGDGAYRFRLKDLIRAGAPVRKVRQ